MSIIFELSFTLTTIKGCRVNNCVGDCDLIQGQRLHDQQPSLIHNRLLPEALESHSNISMVHNPQLAHQFQIRSDLTIDSLVFVSSSSVDGAVCGAVESSTATNPKRARSRRRSNLKQLWVPWGRANILESWGAEVCDRREGAFRGHGTPWGAVIVGRGAREAMGGGGARDAEGGLIWRLLEGVDKLLTVYLSNMLILVHQ